MERLFEFSDMYRTSVIESPTLTRVRDHDTPSPIGVRDS